MKNIGNKIVNRNSINSAKCFDDGIKLHVWCRLYSRVVDYYILLAFNISKVYNKEY